MNLWLRWNYERIHVQACKVIHRNKLSAIIEIINKFNKTHLIQLLLLFKMIKFLSSLLFHFYTHYSLRSFGDSRSLDVGVSPSLPSVVSVSLSLALTFLLSSLTDFPDPLLSSDSDL
jgi:hypothetical protein